MSSTVRRHVLGKDQHKTWRLERGRRGATWTQRKAKSKTYCAPTLSR